MRVGKGGTMPRVPNHWGALKSPNSVASTFFNAVHLLVKGLRFKHGTPNLLLAPGAIYPRYAPASLQSGLFQLLQCDEHLGGNFFCNLADILFTAYHTRRYINASLNQVLYSAGKSNFCH